MSGSAAWVYMDSARRVTMLYAGTSIGPLTLRRGCSWVLLSQRTLGFGSLQVSFTDAFCPAAPNKRTIQALPSSLGLKALTRTLGLETSRPGVLGSSPRPGTPSNR